LIVLTTDRILGVAVDEEPLSTYGPGNMLDDSNRNSWVSGFVRDKVTLSNNSQVSALFLGRFQSDTVKFSFMGKDLYEKINGGWTTLQGFRTYYNGGTYKHGLSTGDAVRTQSASNTSSDVNPVGTTDADFVTVVRVNDYVFYYDTTTVDASEAAKTVASGGANGTSTFTVAESDIAFNASNWAVNSPLRWVSANTVTVTSSSGDLVLTTGNPHNLAIGDMFTMNTTHTLFGYVDTDNNDQIEANFLPTTAVNANNPAVNGTFYVKSVPSVSSLTLTRKIPTGSTLKHYSGAASGTGTHYINVVKYGLVSSATNAASVTTVTIKGITSDSATAATETFAGSAGLVTYSKMWKGSVITSASIQTYVNDDSDGTVTGTAGKSIHQAAISSRVFTSLGNFVKGNITQVNSGFIPIPSQVEKSNIEVDFTSDDHRDGGKLITHWMLESLTTSGSAELIGKMSYNAADKGKLVIRFGNSASGTYNAAANPGIEVGDYVSVTLPTSLMYPTSDAVRQVGNPASSVAKTVEFDAANGGVSGIYEGMTAIAQATSVSLGTVTNVNATTRVVTFSGPVVDSSANLTYTFSNPANVADDADTAFTRVHRVVAVEAADGVEGNQITMYAPNYGIYGDLTRKEMFTFDTGTPVAFNRPDLIINSPITGRTIQKVTKGTGRFVREVSNQNTIATLAWDASSTGGTATATFTNDHGLVNNDKILIYNLASVTNGSNIHNLEGSHLVTYSTAKKITFNITKANQQSLTSLTGVNGTTTVTGVTAADHGFVKDDKVHIYGSATHNSIATAHDGLWTVASVPTSKSFTFEKPAALGLTLSETTANMKVTGGVHYRSGGTYQTSAPSLSTVPVARTISIENAKDFNLASGSGEPIKVGNMLWMDGYEESSSAYASSVYTKTPTISIEESEIIDYQTGQSSGVLEYKQSTFVSDFDSTSTVSTDGSVAKNNSPLGQLTLVKGDATTEGDIEVTPPVGKLNQPLLFSSLRHGILVGIMRAGSSIQFPNPQIGVSNKFKDYSVRKDLKTGSYYFLNRESAKIFSGKITGSPDEINPLIDFSQTQLAKPFAVLVMSGNATVMQKLRLRAAIYGYFTDLPSVTFSNKLNNLKDLSFNIKEVL